MGRLVCIAWEQDYAVQIGETDFHHYKAGLLVEV